MAEKENMAMQQATEEFLERLLEESGDGLRAHLAAQCLSCDADKRRLTLAFDLSPWSANYRGFTHGGMTAAVFDQAMGILAFWCAGGMVCQTVNMQVTYLKPVPTSCRLVVEVWCTSSGRTLANFTAKAHVEGSDAIAATATSTYYCKSTR